MGETDFTPGTALLGGVLIGLAAMVRMLGSGRIVGISGIVSRLLPPMVASDRMERIVFVVGLIAAPVLYVLASGQPIQFHVSTNVPLLIAGGLLVGFGSVLGNGCTSGHGVCGMASLSGRSIVAAVVFTVAGMIVVYVMRHMLGGLS